MTRPYLFTVWEATKLIRPQFPSMELRHIMWTNTKTFWLDENLLFTCDEGVDLMSMWGSFDESVGVGSRSASEFSRLGGVQASNSILKSGPERKERPGNLP
eukprot:scaffold7085_cov41-Cyclotella_meneghiniana.AAC.1